MVPTSACGLARAVLNTKSKQINKTKKSIFNLINNDKSKDSKTKNKNLKPEIKEYEEYSKNELLKYEIDSLGFYLTDHPVTEFKNLKGVTFISELSKYFDKYVNIVLLVDRVNEVTTKKGDKMLFITGSDEVNSIDCVLFPKTFDKYKNIEKDKIVKIFGHVEKRFDSYQIVVNKIEVLT